MWARSTAILLAGAQLLTYSAAVHFGVLAGNSLPALLLLLTLVGLALNRSLRDGNTKAWLTFLVITVIAVLAWHSNKSISVLYLPPVLMNLVFALVFAGTLFSGSTPLITQFSMIMKGELDEKAHIYTRRVTQAWVIVFSFLAIQSTLLALYAPPFIWSLFTNFINYLLVAFVFMIEYRVRVANFKEVDHPGFFGFIADLMRLDMRRIKIR